MNEKQFPILINETSTGFQCIVKELYILEEEKELIEAYKKAQERKREILNKFHKAGMTFVLNKSSAKEKTKEKHWISFSLNGLIFAFLLMIPIAAIVQPLTIILTRISHVLQMKPTEFVIRMSERLENMPVEKKIEFKRALTHLLLEAEEFKNLPSDIETAQK